ncbi:MAG: hypothetical protein VB070_08470 [Clostridiaceae bacterium]|nr:hypothetical protein [Clostridiaceae bacterium]
MSAKNLVPDRLRSRRGAASALIILLLVLLVFFGVLALVTAAADLRLSRKQAEWNQQYYLADARAEKLVAELDLVCRSAEKDLDAASLADRLKEKLAANPEVVSSQVEQSGRRLRLEALVAEKADAGQGISLVLQIEAGAETDGSASLTVEQWVQWQPPFTDDDDSGGVWEG